MFLIYRYKTEQIYIENINVGKYICYKKNSGNKVNVFYEIR